MKDRLQRLKRIVDLQNRMKQAREWELANLEHQKSKLVDEKVKLLGALGQLQSNEQLLADVLGKSLAAASKKSAQIDASHKDKHRNLQKQHRQLKHIERVYNEALGDYRNSEQNMEMEDVIDRLVIEKLGAGT